MRKLLLAAFLLGVSALAFGQPAAPASKPLPPRPAGELSAGDAIILGLVEGVTEFLPVSSTGHLIVATYALGLESETPLVGSDGKPLWYKAPSAKNPQGVPLTLKLAADSYTVVIQFGAIAAVILLYWRPIMSMVRGVMGQDIAGLRLAINLITAFLPAAVIGLLIASWIDAHLFTIGAVLTAQVAGAFLMLYAESWRRRRATYVIGTREPADIGVVSSFKIGLMQCAAMWPGTSRSMMTIVGGYFAGLDPRRAAEFSFLLGFVTLSAATAYKSYQSGAAMIAVFGWPHVLLGCAVAAVSAAVAVRFLVGWLTRHGLAAFAVYRLITAAAVAAWVLI